VFGGGNTAIDAAVSAKLGGSKDVKIYYRRGVEDMPAFKDEVEQAIGYGVEIVPYVQPVKFNGNGSLESVTLIRTEPGEKDSSGRSRPVPVAGSETDVAVNAVLLAVGQGATFEHSSIVKTDSRGLIIVNPETGATSHPKIFAGGDAVNGGATVVQAVADGKLAAIGIDEMLRVKG